MSRVVHLKYGDQVEQAETSGSGTLNIKRIANLFKEELDPDSIKLNGISKDVDASYNTTAAVPGGTQDAPIIVSGRQIDGSSSEMKLQMNFLCEDAKRRAAREQTVKILISRASSGKRRLVETVTGLKLNAAMVPVAAQAKRQRVESEFEAARAGLVGQASISKFVWTGDEDNKEEVERMMHRLRALVGWDEFPVELVFLDVHMKELFAVRLPHEEGNIEISGKSDISLNHAGITLGPLVLEDSLMLVELKITLETDSDLTREEPKAYLQYVSSHEMLGRWLPVLLTDGNNFVLYTFDARKRVHQRLHWGFDNIIEASLYLEDFIKKLAADNPVERGYDPSADMRPDAEPGARSGTPEAHQGPGQPFDAPLGMEQDAVHHGASFGSSSQAPAARFSELREAAVEEALRLARFHPIVTAHYGLPPYPKPAYHDLPLYST